MRAAVVPLVALVAGAVAWPAAAGHSPGHVSFAVALKGSAESPSGDPNGSGRAVVTLDAGRGSVCWRITVRGVAPPQAAHIHKGAARESGPIAVPLGSAYLSKSYRPSGCTRASKEVIGAIARGAEGFYVNIHNAEFPPGAVRGQLR